MPEIIPAAPGWYLEETDDERGVVTLDAVIAWKVATDKGGEDVLLPFVSGGQCAAPFVHTEDSLTALRRCVVYRPSHDPENGDVYRLITPTA